MKAIENQITVLTNKADKAYAKYNETDNSDYYFAYDNYLKASNLLKQSLHYYNQAHDRNEKAKKS